MLGQMFFNRFEYWRQESNVEAIRQQLVKCFRCFRGRLFSEMLSGILAMGPRWFVDGRGMLKTLAAEGVGFVWATNSVKVGRFGRLMMGRFERDLLSIRTVPCFP